MPIAAFIVDTDVRIQDRNAAAEQLLGAEPELALHQRGGDALHCINAVGNGCGQDRACQECVIRNGVMRAVAGGKTHRQAHKMELCTGDQAVVVDLLVTATPLSGSGAPHVLLLLEDVSELLTLRGLIPICSQCKKVRDDQQYWHSIESYLHKQMNVKLTHGLCPSCFAEQMKILAAMKKRPPTP